MTAGETKREAEHRFGHECERQPVTDGSLVTISSVILALVSVSALATATVRCRRDAGSGRAERAIARAAEARLGPQVRVLELRIATHTGEVEALRIARASHPVGPPAHPGGDPSDQVASGAAERLRHPGQGRGGVAAPANVIVFPRPPQRRARR